MMVWGLHHPAIVISLRMTWLDLHSVHDMPEISFAARLPVMLGS